MCKTVKIFRHGETVWNKAGILQGWLDSPLTERGKQQAAVQNFLPEVVYSSDLGRAHATAKLMFPANEIHTDASLREINLGNWQGKTISNLLHDRNYQTYIQRPERFTATTQETLQQVTARMLDFIQSLIHRPENNIAIISHGVAISCLNNALQNKPLSTLWDGGLLTGGQSITFRYDKNEWQIVSSGTCSKDHSDQYVYNREI
ncbi:histidine phosphatase family protein [Ureibacillus aquaedulcis]|uniref:Histidine phosphatase family protein n=1 Tax=Ureibacillus aquaedulcis TaxID=3058421 RepID=A0ABT8GRA7_9BACL|nr:histidine phosphatase family protein [Ureibacillus sp. BA0131]MDN4493943.1 histidine phosphatase family protein [Ureibacillus sp. BA0131]